MEFPEVFDSREGGFDAIVGNPPFAGKNTLINGHREHYLEWLQELHKKSHGNANLVAHFFRRAFRILRPNGCLGLIASETIAQGDTRVTSLQAILEEGGTIFRARPSQKWPGEAGVAIAVLHISRSASREYVLDGRPVRRISAYLVEGDLDGSPARLAANAARSFQGAVLLGLGFTFDDPAAAQGKASTLADMHRLIERNPRNVDRIYPYLGGEEVNNSPTHAHHRWCINFSDFPLRRDAISKRWADMNNRSRAECRARGVVPEDYPAPVAADWPDLLEIIERLVKPERAKDKRPVRRNRWWQFAERARALHEAVAGAHQVLAITQTSPHLIVTRLAGGAVYDQKLVVVVEGSIASFGVCQNRVHELWARFFGGRTEAGSLVYAPSDIFDPFPFPRLDVPDLRSAAEAYCDHRAALMVARNEGLTKTYNRFHNPSERAPDIERLRELHYELDLAVLRAYGWDDLAARAAPEFLTEETEPDHRYQGRLFWPAFFRDEVLACLLDLNRARAAEERALGLTAGQAERPEDDQDEAA